MCALAGLRGIRSKWDAEKPRERENEESQSSERILRGGGKRAKMMLECEVQRMRNHVSAFFALLMRRSRGAGRKTWCSDFEVCIRAQPGRLDTIIYHSRRGRRHHLSPRKSFGRIRTHDGSLFGTTTSHLLSTLLHARTHTYSHRDTRIHVDLGSHSRCICSECIWLTTSWLG